MAYLFAYSMREKTTAHRRYEDDIPRNVKIERLQRMNVIYRSHLEQINRMQIGQLQLILVEGFSKKSNLHMVGRNDGNTKVIFPDGDVPDMSGEVTSRIKPGDYIVVQINASTSQVLKGIPLYHTKLVDYHNNNNNTNEFKDVDYLKYSSMM